MENSVSTLFWTLSLRYAFTTVRLDCKNNAMITWGGNEGLLVSWGITAKVCYLFSEVSMQGVGQKALGRIHLHTGMSLTEQFYCMIIFYWKHAVLSNWHINRLYFIMCIYLITLCFIWSRSTSANIHFDNKGQSANRSYFIVDALAPPPFLNSMDSQKFLTKVGQLIQLVISTPQPWQ